MDNQKQTDQINNCTCPKISSGMIIAIVITALVVGGVIYFWQNNVYSNQIEELNNRIEELESQSNQQTNIDNSTADWLTYRNEEYGFEVKHPKGYKVTLNPLDEISIPLNDIDQLFDITADNNDLFSIGVTQYDSIQSLNQKDAVYPFLSKSIWDNEKEMIEKNIITNCSATTYNIDDNTDFCEIYTNPNNVKFIAIYWYHNLWASNIASYITYDNDHRIQFVYAKTPTLATGETCFSETQEQMRQCNQSMKSGQGIDKETSNAISVYNQILSTFKFLD